MPLPIAENKIAQLGNENIRTEDPSERLIYLSSSKIGWSTPAKNPIWVFLCLKSIVKRKGDDMPLLVARQLVFPPLLLVIAIFRALNPPGRLTAALGS